MKIGNKIKKRLTKINGFLESDRKSGPEIIHLLRLEIKHLEAYLELMAIQDDFGARPEIPENLKKLFHDAGKVRKFGLEIKAIQSATDENGLSKPTHILQELDLSKQKTSKKLRRKRNSYPDFKLHDFAEHPDSELSAQTWQRFIDSRADFILNLSGPDIMADARSLHELRKILKSVLYVLPFAKDGVKPVREFLGTKKKFLISLESRIGSIHDTDFFIRWLEKKQNLIDAAEQNALEKIKQEWENELKKMKEGLQPMLADIRQFALDLKERANEPHLLSS